jgi:hypothetical protein
LQGHQYPDGLNLHELIPADAEQIPLARRAHVIARSVLRVPHEPESVGGCH